MTSNDKKKLGIFLLLLAVAMIAILGGASVALAQDGVQCLEVNGRTGCPGTVADPIVAAWATEGYWFMGDIVYSLINTNFSVLAPLLYICAATAGLVMMALGQPPRAYLWFLMGPALYGFFLSPDVPVQGVAYQFARRPVDQSRVWENTLVGLTNQSSVRRLGIDVTRDGGPQGTIDLPMPFVMFDEVISAQMREFSHLIGVTYKRGSNDGGSGDLNQRIIAPPPATPDADADVEGDSQSSSWYFLAQDKWRILQDVTKAQLFNPNLRGLFNEFLASECGDALADGLLKDAFSAAAFASRQIPQSVYGNSFCTKGDYDDNILQQLKGIQIPPPRSYVNLIKEGAAEFADLGCQTPNNSAPISSDFRYFENSLVFMPITESSAGATGCGDGNPPLMSSVSARSCLDFMHTIVQGFRWEAGHAYNQIVRSASDRNIARANIPYDFTYGWDFGDNVSLTPGEQEQYMIHLIMVHMFRNELALTPSRVNSRWTTSEKIIESAEGFISDTGSFTKGAELETWSRLMPYVQGAAMYMIIAAYPFCVVVMVMPGRQKTLITWAAFYTWVKSWDLGFAFVNSLERSLWAMIGNHGQQESLNRHLIAHISPDVAPDNSQGCTAPLDLEFGGVFIESGCTGIGSQDGVCLIPDVSSVPAAYPKVVSMALWDEMMILAPYLDLDLKNGYYIYLMSALYFAVPVVTGQVLLGAKAGAAQLMSSLNNAASSAGDKGASGYGSGMTKRQSVGQEQYEQSLAAKGNRQQGKNGQTLAGNVIGTSNSIAGLQGQSNKNQQQKAVLGNQNAAIGDASAENKEENEANKATNDATWQAMSNAAKIFTGRDRDYNANNPSSGSSPVNNSSTGANSGSTTGGSGKPVANVSMDTGSRGDLGTSVKNAEKNMSEKTKSGDGGLDYQVRR